MSGTMPIPTVLPASGAQPQTPASLRALLISLVQAAAPGYTSNLPGSLIEDVASTDTYALAVSDQARVDLINSLTPFGSNAFLTNQLGQIYGVPPDQETTTSVYVVFSGPVDYVIQIGFTVSDGTYQYTIQDGGIIGVGGVSSPLYCLAVLAGSWAVPANTVNVLITSAPAQIALTVTNPLAGLPGTSAQTEESYRASVLRAGLAVSQGMATTLTTYLHKISGVQYRLISVRQVSGSWQVIVGGGDPYSVAYAIWQALFDTSALVGSTMSVTNVTQANPGVVTTLLNHGYLTGQTVSFTSVVGMVELNGNSYTATVTGQKTFSINQNTTGFTAYVSGGVLSPNARNIVASVANFPDTYAIPFVNPPQQSVSVSLTWNTLATNIISSVAVAQLAIPAIVSYVNGITVGQPINLFSLQDVFQEAVAGIIPRAQLTRMVFSVSINGISTPPEAGTGIIAGDPESYFLTNSTLVTVVQG